MFRVLFGYLKKVCTKCQQVLALEDFYLRKSGERKGKYYQTCKNCYKLRGRQYYFNNHDRQLKLAKNRKKLYQNQRKEWLSAIKSKPCQDCGQCYPPYVMDFDHRDSDTKIASISLMSIRNTSSFEKIKLEIEKCDLVCANCHRQRTHDRILKFGMPQ